MEYRILQQNLTERRQDILLRRVILSGKVCLIPRRNLVPTLCLILFPMEQLTVALCQIHCLTHYQILCLTLIQIPCLIHFHEG